MIDEAAVSIQAINGDPRGVKICRAAEAALIAVVVPRKLVDPTKQLPDIPNYGVYFLLEDEIGRLHQVGVGQTTSGIAELDNHFAEKWWNKAVMFFASDNTFAKETVCKLASQCGEYIATHGGYKCVVPADAQTPEGDNDTNLVVSSHEEIIFLMTLLGFDLDACWDPTHAPRNVRIFHISDRYGIQAKGSFVEDTGIFRVDAYSQIDMGTQPGSADRPAMNIANLRKSLLDSGVIKLDEEGVYHLTDGVGFNTPSEAAMFVLGGKPNGWTEWINDKGQTLYSVYRRKR